MTVEFDYSYDTDRFFADQARRNVLQDAADSVAAKLGDSLSAIQPAGVDTWTPTFFDPSNPSLTLTVADPSIPQNTIVIYVGGSTLPSSGEAGLGGPGGYTASGDQAWLNTVQGRGQAGALASPPTDFGPWGGAISFDDSANANWYFGATPSGIRPDQVDFFTVAEHEIGHILGLGTAPSWKALDSKGDFVGPAAEAVNGGRPVPLDPAGEHWADGTVSQGQDAVMDPVISEGTVRYYTPLDLAGLADIGWDVSAPTGGSAEGRPTGDYLGNGKTAPAVFRRASPYAIDWFVKGDPALTNHPFGAGSLDVPLVGDFDGDGATDLAVYRPSTAQWFVQDSGSGYASALLATFGQANSDLPVPGNYNGNGVTDLAVYRPSTGQWFLYAGGNGHNVTLPVAFPRGADPVPGDYDNVGKDEAAVYNPGTGRWVVESPGATTTHVVAAFGGPDDVPVPGAYDALTTGNMGLEAAVWRPSTGQFFIHGPTGNRVIQFAAGDIPAPGDYDGIGETEAAVYRPSTGRWLVLGPGDTTPRVFATYGGPQDVPPVAPYAYRALKSGGGLVSVYSVGTPVRLEVGAPAPVSDEPVGPSPVTSTSPPEVATPPPPPSTPATIRIRRVTTHRPLKQTDPDDHPHGKVKESGKNSPIKFTPASEKWWGSRLHKTRPD